MSQGNNFEISQGQEGDCKPSAWIMRGKSINFIAFSEDMIGLADEGRAVDGFYLDFTKVCDLAAITSSSFLIDSGKQALCLVQVVVDSEAP